MSVVKELIGMPPKSEALLVDWDVVPASTANNILKSLPDDILDKMRTRFKSKDKQLIFISTASTRKSFINDYLKESLKTKIVNKEENK